MKTRILFILLVISCRLFAQDKDFPHCKYTYFRKGGKVATSQCFDKMDRWGKAKAYSVSGQVIYERELRRFAGHSSVEFSFYDNGAVKKAFWSSAPDGGIQWYRSTTYFSEDGKITSEQNDSYDNSPGTIMKHEPTQPEKPKPATVVTCAVIYSSEFWFTNTTKYTVEVTATRKFNNSERYTAILKPHESLQCGQMINAEHFDEPDKYYDFSAKLVKSNIRQKLIIIPSDKKPENPKKEVRRYYYEVRRIV